MKVGEEIGKTGFLLAIAAPHRLAIVTSRSPRGGEPVPLFEATRVLPDGRTRVTQTASSLEALQVKCADWVRAQMVRKDGGALTRRPVRVRVGMISASAAARRGDEAA